MMVQNMDKNETRFMEYGLIDDRPFDAAIQHTLQMKLISIRKDSVRNPDWQLPA